MSRSWRLAHPIFSWLKTFSRKMLLESLSWRSPSRVLLGNFNLLFLHSGKQAMHFETHQSRNLQTFSTVGRAWNEDRGGSSRYSGSNWANGATIDMRADRET